jgi:UDP-N-acetyl-D-mannosaminuronate dehydrogenase
MTYVFNSGNFVAATLHRGQLVILESTTYPGTADGELRSILEKNGHAGCAPTISSLPKFKKGMCKYVREK